MKVTCPYIDPDQAATGIRATLAARQIRIKDYAKARGMTRQLLSQFLNRHLDLRQGQIEDILNDLGIRHVFK